MTESHIVVNCDFNTRRQIVACYYKDPWPALAIFPDFDVAVWITGVINILSFVKGVSFIVDTYQVQLVLNDFDCTMVVRHRNFGSRRADSSELTYDFIFCDWAHVGHVEGKYTYTSVTSVLEDESGVLHIEIEQTSVMTDLRIAS